MVVVSVTNWTVVVAETARLSEEVSVVLKVFSVVVLFDEELDTDKPKEVEVLVRGGGAWTEEVIA